MSKVSSLRKVEAHESITRIQQCNFNGKVRLRSRMRLDIGILGTIYRAESVDCQLLNLVHHLAATIITLARITFCIFVRADGTHGIHNLVTDIVF